MTHIKSTYGRKRFIHSVVKRSKSPRETAKIYRAVERIIKYKPKNRYSRRRRMSSSRGFFRKPYRSYKLSNSRMDRAFF